MNKDMQLKYQFVEAFAPASIGNVACGFDIMGLVIGNEGDIVRITVLPKNEMSSVKMTGEYGHLIPNNWNENTASVAIDYYLKHIQQKVSLLVEVQKNLPLGSGMGSSAASSAAAVIAVNQLYGNPLTTKELLPFAMEGERLACGAAHADNVAPSLLGGFVLIRSYEPLDVIEISFQSNWWITVCHPHTVLRTIDSRKVLPQEVSLQKAIQQSANAAALIIAMTQQDESLMKSCLHDEFAEPQRRQLIPNFLEIEKKVKQIGAFNCNISGSGPSIFSISDSESKATMIGNCMKHEFEIVGLKSQYYISKLKSEGAKILSFK